MVLQARVISFTLLQQAEHESQTNAQKLRHLEQINQNLLDSAAAVSEQHDAAMGLMQEEDRRLRAREVEWEALSVEEARLVEAAQVVRFRRLIVCCLVWHFLLVCNNDDTIASSQ